MKRFLPAVVVGLVVVLLVLGSIVFFLTRKKEPDPTVVTYIGEWDPDVINPLKEEFQKQNPNVIIEYEQKDASRYFSYLTTALASKNPPDLFWYHNSWEPVIQKYLAPLPASVLSSADFEKTFYPITKENLKVGGFYRGIPLEIDGLALLYNKTMLASKGFKVPPADFTSLRENYAPVLTQVDDQQHIQIGGVALGDGQNVDDFGEIIGLLLLQNKTVFIQNNRNVLASNATIEGRNLAADALAIYTSFLYTDKVWSKLLPPSTEAFVQGKVAMIYLPAYRLAALLQELKEKNLKLNFGVAPVPQIVASDPVTWGSYWVNGVSLASKNSSAAWKFAKFLSEKDSLRKIFAAEKKLRGVGQVYPRVDMATELSGDPLLGAYVKEAPAAKNWYLSGENDDDQLNGPLVDIFSKSIEDDPNPAGQEGNIVKIASDIEPILEKFGLSQALVKQ